MQSPEISASVITSGRVTDSSGRAERKERVCGRERGRVIAPESIVCGVRSQCPCQCVAQWRDLSGDSSGGESRKQVKLKAKIEIPPPYRRQGYSLAAEEEEDIVHGYSLSDRPSC